MNKLILTIALTISTGANALTCTNDQECLAEGLKLIKAAVKLGVCDTLVQKTAKNIELVATQSPEMSELEACLTQGKKELKLQKKQILRQKRIEKALSAQK